MHRTEEHEHVRKLDDLLSSVARAELHDCSAERIDVELLLGVHIRRVQMVMAVDDRSFAGYENLRVRCRWGGERDRGDDKRGADELHEVLLGAESLHYWSWSEPSCWLLSCLRKSRPIPRSSTTIACPCARCPSCRALRVQSAVRRRRLCGFR